MEWGFDMVNYRQAKSASRLGVYATRLQLQCCTAHESDRAWGWTCFSLVTSLLGI